MNRLIWVGAIVFTFFAAALTAQFISAGAFFEGRTQTMRAEGSVFHDAAPVASDTAAYGLALLLSPACRFSSSTDFLLEANRVIKRTSENSSLTPILLGILSSDYAGSVSLASQLEGIHEVQIGPSSSTGLLRKLASPDAGGRPEFPQSAIIERNAGADEGGRVIARFVGVDGLREAEALLARLNHQWMAKSDG